MGTYQNFSTIRMANRTLVEQLYHEHFEKFYLIAFKYFKDEGKAEDVVHDFFLGLLEQISFNTSLSSELEMEKYMITRLINFCKKKSRSENMKA